MTRLGENCVLGLDFGSDSVRAVVVRVADGEELAAGERFGQSWPGFRPADGRGSSWRRSGGRPRG